MYTQELLIEKETLFLFKEKGPSLSPLGGHCSKPSVFVLDQVANFQMAAEILSPGLSEGSRVENWWFALPIILLSCTITKQHTVKGRSTRYPLSSTL